MAEQYKIDLGIGLNDKQLASLKQTINNLVEKERKIDIGVDFDIKNVNKLVEAGKQVEEIKKQLNSSTKGKTSVPIDTKTLESSLKKTHEVIKNIRKSIGTIDSKKGVQSLLTSINHISNELKEVTNQFKTLNGTLTSLSSKDFSINLGLNFGGTNAKNTDQLRSELKQLQTAAGEYERYIQGLYTTDKYDAKKDDPFTSVRRLINEAKNVNGMGGKLLQLQTVMADSGTSDQKIRAKIEAYKQYIALIREASSIAGKPLTSVEQRLVESGDFTNLKQEAKDAKQELKNLLGSIDAESLSASLKPIVDDLGEIKTVLQNLSSGTSVEGLTSSFKELSEVLKEFVSNVTLAKNTLGDVGSNIGGSVGQGNSGLGNVEQDMAQIVITANNASNTIQHMRDVLSKSKFDNSSIDIVTKDLEQMSLEVQKVETNINGKNLRMSITGIETTEDGLKRVVNVVKEYNYQTGEITTGNKRIVQTFETSADAAKKLERETKESFQDLKSLAQEMGNLDVKIAGLDSGRNADEIDKLTQKLNKLQSEFNELYAATEKNLNSEQIDDLAREFIDTSDRLDVVKAKIADTTAYNKVQAEIEETKNAFKELVAVADKIDNVNSQIVKLDEDSNANEIALLTSKLKELEQTYQELRGNLQGKLSDGQLASLSMSAIEANEELERVQAKLKDTQAKLAKKIELKIDRGKISAEIKKVTTDFGKLSIESEDIKTDINNLNQHFANMKTASAKGDIDALIASYKEYEKVLESVNNKIKISSLSEQEANRQRKQQNDINKLEQDKKNFALEIDYYLKSNSVAAKEFGDRIREIRAAIDTCDDSAALDNLKAQLRGIKTEASTTLKSTQSLGDKIKKQWQQYSTYLGVASIFSYAEQALRSMFEQVKLIDSAMTELKKVTNETDASYSKFLKNASSRAKEIGTTIDGLVSSTADFARLGYGFEDAQGLAEVANIYAVVGDEIEGVEGATESLISTMAAFKDEMNGMSDSEFAMSIIDKFNEIGNNFAISSGGIGEALERSASSLMAANNTIDESIALITAANTVVQDPTQVGTAFKTISMRIRGAKTELEEMGEDTTGMVDSTAKLREEIMALSGVDIMISPTEFKSTYQIMDELAQKWEDLTDIQQAKCLPDNVEIH